MRQTENIIFCQNKFVGRNTSICYNNVRKRTIIGPTKRNKIRTVDFFVTLAGILRAAKQEQKQGRRQDGGMSHLQQLSHMCTAMKIHIDGTGKCLLKRFFPSVF